MRERARPNEALRHLLLVRLQPRDQLGQRLGRQSAAREHQQRARDQQRDRLEIGHHVIGQRIDRAVEDLRADVADADGVAVRRRARDAADAERAARAADVLDHEGLPERAAHVLGDDARDLIHRTAGRIRHDHGDRPRRIRLRRRTRDAQDDGAEGCGDQPEHSRPISSARRRPLPRPASTPAAAPGRMR